MVKRSKKMNHNFEDSVQRWLNSKVSDPSIEDIDDEVSCLPQRYGNGSRDMEDFYCYYMDMEDQDVIATQKFERWVEPSRQLESVKESYIKNFEGSSGWRSGTKQVRKVGIPDYINALPNQIDIKIPPHTNRYHANFLFKQLVDYGVRNNLIYKIYDPKDKKWHKFPLVHPVFKDAFYNFCYRYTKKKVWF